ncbi:hypothetical protein CSE16_12690 [Solibacillus sp. R5-41]|uniref:UPF0715 family protein n=1 Tax=Solibacillus sp. R5-41 TaxID=2048654 RepID=UPI000C1271A2|nr:UPF0715 family protein [Solibacillus sp. R5-41]ATP40038.1 hypothetical protein CSE16_08245 [Solibacillus sp. R5-41]ATP40831.1 hypothetical protein CSE16_12690 [Solibacillus sp. R5-41]
MHGKINIFVFYFKVLLCSILSGFSLSLLVCFLTVPRNFNPIDIFFIGLIYSIVYLIPGALIQSYLDEKKINIRASKLFLIYLITGTIVTTIFYALDHVDFYKTSNYYFTVLSSSVVFWLYDLILFRRK